MNSLCGEYWKTENSPMKHFILTLLLFIYAQGIVAQERSGPMNYTDYVISKLTQRFADNKITASFAVGGTLAFESKKYMENATSDIDGMLIFQTRAELETFLANHNQDQLRDIIGFSQTFVGYTPEELNQFLKKPLQMLDMYGSVDGLRVSIKLTDKETLVATAIDAPFETLTKIDQPRIFQSHSLKGDNVEVILVNKTLNNGEKPSYISLDRFYFTYQDTKVIGRITDYLATAKSISDPSGTIAMLQSQARSTIVDQLVKNGCLAKKASPVDYLLHSELYGNEYKKDIIDKFEDKIDDREDNINACTRATATQAYLIDINLKHLTAQPFEYQSITAEDKIGDKPEDFHSLIIQALPSFADNPKELTILPYAAGLNKLVSDDGLGHVAKIGAEQRLVAVYPFQVMLDKDPELILKKAKVINNLAALYPHIVKPHYVDREYRFLINQAVEENMPSKRLSHELYQSWGKKTNNMLTMILNYNETRLNAYLSALPVAVLSFQDDTPQQYFFGAYSSKPFEQWYDKQSITLPDGQQVAFEELKDMTFVINGKKYTSLANMIDLAKKTLNPENLSDKIKVYGAVRHSAKNMVKLTKDSFVLTDYTYAGVVHPSQDLAETILNDVYYNLIHSATSNGNKVTVSIDSTKNQIVMTHDYQLDRQQQMLLDIYLNSILKPLLIVGVQQYQQDVSDWQAILQASIFTRGLLTDNLFAQGLPGWLTLAVLLEISSPVVDDTVRPFQDIQFECCSR